MLSNLLFFASTLAATTASTALVVPGSTPAANTTTPANTSSSSMSAVANSAGTIGSILFTLDPHMIAPSSVSSILASSLASSPMVLVTPVPPVLSETTTTEVITTTYTLTESLVTITVSAAPSTITDTITATPSPSQPPPSPQPTPTQQTWAAPAQMSDLSAFNVSAFPGGQRNLDIVNGIPASASATSLANAAFSTSPAGLAAVACTSWDNSSSVLQLLYPENSINPAAKPQGGAEFYATPLAMQNANNVSLEYSVFFPVDYDWVLGGKLPGLYGGHTGCSGGNNALTCFSTRLMWRPKGMGELYLYAPKAKQTHALCSDPQSVCDATYGFSIGRGSFQYASGGWTHVRQSVVLNTPGKQDGAFTLDVNGKRVINRTDVFYRDAPPPPKMTKPKPSGILGPLLGGLLPDMKIFRARDEHNEDLPPLFPQPTAHQLRPANDAAFVPNFTDQSAPSQAISTHHETVIMTMTSPASTVIKTAPAATVTALFVANGDPVDEETPLFIDSAPASPQPQPVGFTGIFFSTFFGGHERQYATPRDQYTWFKDFAVSCQ